MGAASKRPAARSRLTAGFLAGLSSSIRDIGGMLSEGSDDLVELAQEELRRLSETATSLGLTGIGAAAERARDAMSAHPHVEALRPLLRELAELEGPRPFAPIGFVGTARTGASLRGQDDGACEPFHTFDSVAALRQELALERPQAIVIPASASAEVSALGGLFDCPIHVYGGSRDEAAHLAGARAGAAAYHAEPLALPELLAHIRSVGERSHAGSAARSEPLIALVGDSGWSQPLAGALEAAGMRTLLGAVGGLASLMHASYPDAVVLGPDVEAGLSLRVLRQHVGRGHVALVAVTDGPAALLFAAGADDVLSPADDLPARLSARLARFADHRRDRDELTQLPNRVGALESLHRWVAWTSRNHTPLAVGLVSVEGLGEATAQHGRETGNACRRHLAAALERGLRRHDLVGSLSPELFLGVLPGCRIAEAERRMQEICVGFESRVRADRRLRDISVARGLADTTLGVQGLLVRASAALDAARAASA